MPKRKKSREGFVPPEIQSNPPSGKILADVRLFVVLLSDVHEDRTILLLDFIDDLIASARPFERSLVAINLFAVDLQHMLLVIEVFVLLSKNERLKNAGSLYAFHGNTSFSARCIRQNGDGQDQRDVPDKLKAECSSCR